MAAIAAIHEAAHVASYWRFDGVGALVKSSRDFRDSKFESLREIAAQWMTERFLAQQTQTAWQKCHDKFCRIYQAPENTLDWKAECYYLWRLFENISETDLDRWRAIESWLILDDGSLSDLMASLQKPDLKPACVKFV